MDKQIQPLESEALQKPDRAPRGMLGRIRKATGDFDFSALISGTRRPPTPRTGTEPPGPTAYVPVDDTVPALARLWEAPPKAPEKEEPVQVPEWERAKPPPSPSNRPYSTIYEPIDEEPAYVRSSRARSRRKRRVGFGRAVFTRILLCLWAILFGACLGAGGGPLAERFTEYRAVPASYIQSITLKLAKPASKPTRGRRTGSTRRGNRTAAARPSNSPKTSHAADPWQPYRDLLTLPVVALGVASLLWVFGLPDLFGEFDNAGYWTLAIATFGLAAWCGLQAMMAALEIRAVRPPASNGRSARIEPPYVRNLLA